MTARLTAALRAASADGRDASPLVQAGASLQAADEAAGGTTGERGASTAAEPRRRRRTLLACGAARGLYLTMLAIRYICVPLLPLLQTPLPGSRYLVRVARRPPPEGSRVRLVDLSATLHLMAFKLRQFCLVPFGSPINLKADTTQGRSEAAATATAAREAEVEAARSDGDQTPRTDDEDQHRRGGAERRGAAAPRQPHGAAAGAAGLRATTARDGQGTDSCRA